MFHPTLQVQQQPVGLFSSLVRRNPRWLDVHGRHPGRPRLGDARRYCCGCRHRRMFRSSIPVSISSSQHQASFPFWRLKRMSPGVSSTYVHGRWYYLSFDRGGNGAKFSWVGSIRTEGRRRRGISAAVHRYVLCLQGQKQRPSDSRWSAAAPVF